MPSSCLHVLHLLLNLLHRDLATEDGCDGEVTTVSRVSGSHHVLSIEHLLGELRNSNSAVLLAAASGQGSETSHKEVKTGERNHVDGQLPQIRVELARETQTCRNTRHNDGNEVVEVTVCRCREFEGPEADVVEGLVINTECFVRVLNKLMDGKGGVVWLDDSVRHLGTGHNRVRAHHPVGVLLTDLRDQESTHTSTSASTK